MNDRVHKLPGQSRWDNIVLRYGVTSDVSLMEWRGEILTDDFDQGSRRKGSIVVKNNQMEVVRRYNTSSMPGRCLGKARVCPHRVLNWLSSQWSSPTTEFT